jgi:hypothetical protein
LERMLAVTLKNLSIVMNCLKDSLLQEVRGYPPLLRWALECNGVME